MSKYYRKIWIVMKNRGQQFCLVLLFFTLDIFQFLIFERLLFYCLLDLFCVVLFFPIQRLFIPLIGLLLSIESWFFYSHFWLSLLYLLPICLIAAKSRYFMYPQLMQPLITAIICLFFHLLVLELLFLDISIGINCTGMLFCANLIFVTILSMKLKDISHTPTVL